MNFEWDENKNQANIKKHGVDFRDACYVFADQFALNMPDDEHSDDEERWLLLGASPNGKILLVVHTRYNSNNIGKARHQKRTKYIQQKKGIE